MHERDPYEYVTYKFSYDMVVLVLLMSVMCSLLCAQVDEMMGVDLARLMQLIPSEEDKAAKNAVVTGGVFNQVRPSRIPLSFLTFSYLHQSCNVLYMCRYVSLREHRLARLSKHSTEQSGTM